MPDTYVIHIGPPKAGSKYLQTSLGGINRQLDRDGILFPVRLLSDSRRASHNNLHPLLGAGPPQPAMEQAFEEMNAGPHRTVVLSWEGASALPKPALEYFRRLIGKRQVRIVYYCRRFAERIPSLWKQDVKMGGTETLPEAVVRAMRIPIKVEDLNPSLAWARWADVFGRESLNLVSFNNLRDRQVDLFSHFTETFLDWRGRSRPETVMSNESPGAFDTEVIRALNAIHAARTGERSDALREAYLNTKDRLTLGVLPEAMERDTAALQLDDRAQPFLPVYDAMMEFADRLATPQHGTELFARALSQVPYVRQGYLFQPGVQAALQALYARVRTVQLEAASSAHAA